MLDRTTETVTAAAITLQAGDLHDAFARTRHAMSREQTRYYLAGVYIHLSPDWRTLNFVATDGHRLAHVRVPLSAPAQFAPVLVKADFVVDAIKLLGRKSQHLLSATLRIAPRAVSVTNWEGERIETEPVECSYPDYARVLPHEPPARAIVVKDDLLAALEPIAGFLRPTRQKAVKLTAAGNTLTLSVTVQSAYSNEVGGKAEAVVKLSQPVNQPYETGFNAEFLVDALRTFSNRRHRSPAVVSICGNDAGAPHLIECDRHETYVLMPMRV